MNTLSVPRAFHVVECSGACWFRGGEHSSEAATARPLCCIAKEAAFGYILEPVPPHLTVRL